MVEPYDKLVGFMTKVSDKKILDEAAAKAGKKRSDYMRDIVLKVAYKDIGKKGK